MMDNGYRDRDTLKELYHERDLYQREIAEIYGVGQTTISKWISIHDLNYERRGEGTAKWTAENNPPFASKDELEQLYYEEGLSQAEIAEQFDVSPARVSNRMVNLGINPGHDRLGYAKFRTDEEGYELWNSSGDFVRHHRLLMVALEGFDAVKGKVVHHENNIPWDNRPDNVKLMTWEDHGRLHRLEQDFR